MLYLLFCESNISIYCDQLNLLSLGKGDVIFIDTESMLRAVNSTESIVELQ